MEKSIKSIENLAILGGTPLFSSTLHVGVPTLPNRESFSKRVDAIYQAKWLTNDGNQVKEFEQKVRSITGAKHAIATCNATIALELAVRALGFKDEVIVPSFTFIASAHSLSWQGIRPVFCDVKSDHGIDVKKAEALITPRTTGILAVNLWGRPCDVEGLQDLAKRRGLKLLFDSAHGFGCTHRGKPLGGFGSAEVFSFHATKFINSSEGGAICTNDDQLAERLRYMRNFGFSGYDRADSIGTNGKMCEISAAMGNVSIEEMDKVIALNRSRYEQYRKHLTGLPGVSQLLYSEKEKNNYHYLVLDLDPERLLLTRDEVLSILLSENILVRRYFWPGCHRMLAYEKENRNVSLPVTDRIASGILVFPNGASVSVEEVDKICALLKLIVGNQEEICRKIRLQKKAA